MKEDRIQCLFGIACRTLREKQGISQEKLALKINMDRTYYSSVESGKRNISLKNISRIAQGLNISLPELFIAIEQLKQNEAIK